MKNLLLNLTFTTLLLSVGYSQCNESNWQDYYPNMQGCDLYGAYLSGANLSNADLNGVNLCNLTGSPSGDVCEESGGITDDNGDGYDDTSYDAGFSEGADSVTPEDGIGQSDVDAAYSEGYDAGFDIGALSGDSNGDGVLDVLDLVYFVEIIVSGE